MYEYKSPDGGPELKAWYSEGIEKVRVTSSPGGISLDAAGVRELRDKLDEMLAQFEAVEA